MRLEVIVAKKVSSRVRVRTRLVLQQNGALLAQKSGGKRVGIQYQ